MEVILELRLEEGAGISPAEEEEKEFQMAEEPSPRQGD